MERGEFCNVGDRVAFECHSIPQALRLEVGEVEGGVDADGGEGSRILYAGGKRGVVLDDFELTICVQYMGRNNCVGELTFGSRLLHQGLSVSGSLLISGMKELLSFLRV